MLSRGDTIRQILAGMEPSGGAQATPAFSGPVSQVNIISNATINIDSQQFTQGDPGSPAEMGEQLAELVHTLSVLESHTSGRHMPPSSIWVRLKRGLGLPVDKPIPARLHQEAADALVRRLALARDDLQRDPATARRRAAAYRRCHAMAQQHGLYPSMRKYMDRQWGAESMRDLGDEELWSLERFMRQQSRQRKA